MNIVGRDTQTVSPYSSRRYQRVRVPCKGTCAPQGYNPAGISFGGCMTDPAMFSLSDEHKMIRDTARDFAQKEIAPIAAEFDESGEFPMKTVQKMGELGFMGIEVSEQYG